MGTLWYPTTSVQIQIMWVAGFQIFNDLMVIIIFVVGCYIMNTDACDSFVYSGSLVEQCNGNFGKGYLIEEGFEMLILKRLGMK